jgi:hypothetical protein
MATVTYVKLKSGDWGVRATAPLTEGSRVTVTKRSGETKDEVVTRRVWDNGAVYLYAVAPRRAAPRATPRGGWDYCDYCGAARPASLGDAVCARCGEVS